MGQGFLGAPDHRRELRAMQVNGLGDTFFALHMRYLSARGSGAPHCRPAVVYLTVKARRLPSPSLLRRALLARAALPGRTATALEIASYALRSPGALDLVSCGPTWDVHRFQVGTSRTAGRAALSGDTDGGHAAVMPRQDHDR